MSSTNAPEGAFASVTGYVAWVRISHDEAEKLHGGKLDARRTYYAREDRASLESCETGTPCVVHTLEDLGPTSCSGCYESIDGQAPKGTRFTKGGVPIGCGCHECGHNGVRRERMYWPVEPHNGGFSGENAAYPLSGDKKRREEDGR